MMYNVPQFVDVEDKIAGPLTWKQLGWIFVAGVILFVLWNTLEIGAFIAVAIPIVILFVALAFYRPYGQPMIKMVFHGFAFLFRPKVYVWQQLSNEPKRSVVKQKTSPDKNITSEFLTLEEINSLSQVLDDPDVALNKRASSDTLKK